MAPKRGRSIDGPASAAMTPKRRRVGRRSAAGAGASTPLAPPPADVIFEILSWLPVRSLSRSRCVCTAWRALISEPAFVAAHRSRAEPLVVAAIYSNTTYTTSLQIMDTDGHVVRAVETVDLGNLWTFRASLDGLVLLTSCPDDRFPTVRAIDLAARENIVSFPRPGEAVGRVVTRFGFGRAARSGTIKVLRIVLPIWSSFRDNREKTCEVLTLGDGGGSGWRQTGLPQAAACDSHDRNDGVAVNGVLHFLSRSEVDIVSFDLESEEWTAINGPPGINSSLREKICLAELKGALCIAHAKRYTVNLWLLTDLNKGVWVSVYTISIRRASDLVPLTVMRSGKLIFYYRRDYGSTGILQVYDPCSGECTSVEKAPNVPIGIIDRIGLCSSHLDSRLYGQP